MSNTLTDTATDYRMVQRGLRAMERMAESAPYGGEFPALPLDAWWHCMVASAERVMSAHDATDAQAEDAWRLCRDLGTYADDPAV